MVRVGSSASETETGLIHGQHYVVKDVANDADGVNIGSIATYTQTVLIDKVTMSNASNAEAVGFTKVEKGLKVQTLDRDEN